MWLYVAALAMVNPNPKGAFLNCCNAWGVCTPTVLLGRDFQLHIPDFHEIVGGYQIDIFHSTTLKVSYSNSFIVQDNIFTIPLKQKLNIPIWFQTVTYSVSLFFIVNVRLGLFHLEQRRLRGDLIEVDKILTGLDKVDKEKLFPFADGTRMRGTQS